jgi:hypothetical protein
MTTYNEEYRVYRIKFRKLLSKQTITATTTNSWEEGDSDLKSCRAKLFKMPSFNKKL